jgi:protein SCO1/2
VFILDSRGRVAATFERLHWSEEAVTARAAALLHERHRPDWVGRTATAFGTVASVGFAFFPKCPICWATYLSVFGLTSLQSLLCASWLRPALAAAMVINLACIAARARRTRRYWPLALAATGGLAVFGLKAGLGWDETALLGVLLMLAGSAASVVRMPERNKLL